MKKLILVLLLSLFLIPANTEATTLSEFKAQQHLYQTKNYERTYMTPAQKQQWRNEQIRREKIRKERARQEQIRREKMRRERLRNERLRREQMKKDRLHREKMKKQMERRRVRY